MKGPLSHHDIYDAALDDTLFDALPVWMAREIDVPSAVFIWLHPGDYREITAGTQAEANEVYNDFEGHDPWLAQATDDKLGIGAFRLSDSVSAREFERSEMYNAFIRENRLDRYWCLGMMHGTRDGRVATAFHKSRRGGDFTDAEHRSINRHAEDLGRLHTIRRELHRNRIRDIVAADNSLIDDTPVFELDHQGRLLRLNGKAELLVRLHPALAVDARRVLKAQGRGERGFRAAVGAATEAVRRRAGAVELGPARAEDGRLIPALRLNFLPRTEGGRKVLVIATTEAEGGLQALFDAPLESVRLTPRERDVLHGLMRGLRRDQLAHDLDLAVPTIDLHSTNLRLKLGARTIAEAVALSLKFGLL